MIANPFAQPFDLRLGLSFSELAALREMADVVVETVRFGQKFVRQIEQFLKIVVPRSQSQLFVKHGDSVDHVVEGHAQFGLTLTDLIE